MAAWVIKGRAVCQVPHCDLNGGFSLPTFPNAPAYSLTVCQPACLSVNLSVFKGPYVILKIKMVRKVQRKQVLVVRSP